MRSCGIISPLYMYTPPLDGILYIMSFCRFGRMCVYIQLRALIIPSLSHSHTQRERERESLSLCGALSSAKPPVIPDVNELSGSLASRVAEAHTDRRSATSSWQNICKAVLCTVYYATFGAKAQMYT